MSKQLLLTFFITCSFLYNPHCFTMTERRLKPFNQKNHTNYFTVLPNEIIKQIIIDSLDLENLKKSSYQLYQEEIEKTAQKLLSIKLVNTSLYATITGIDIYKKNTVDNSLSEDIFQIIINSVCGPQQWSINECTKIFGMKQLQKNAQEARTIIENYNLLIQKKNSTIQDRLNTLLQNNILQQYTWFDYHLDSKEEVSKSGIISLLQLALHKKIDLTAFLIKQSIQTNNATIDLYHSFIETQKIFLGPDQDNLINFITKHDIPIFMKHYLNQDNNTLYRKYLDENIMSAYEKCNHKTKPSFLRNTWLHTFFSHDMLLSQKLFPIHLTKMLSNGINPNIQNYTKTTPLHLAIIHKGPANIIKKLLEHKANPNLTDNKNCTPLYYAAQQFNYEVMKLLLEYKADPTKGKCILSIFSAQILQWDSTSIEVGECFNLLEKSYKNNNDYQVTLHQIKKYLSCLNQN